MVFVSTANGKERKVFEKLLSELGFKEGAIDFSDYIEIKAGDLNEALTRVLRDGQRK